MPHSFLKDPLIWVGFAVKLLLIAFVLPPAVAKWYGPFMTETAFAYSLNPWGNWLASGGDYLAFPYGYVMWLILLPATWAFKIFGSDSHLGYSITLLVVDFLALVYIVKLVGGKSRLAGRLYWLSPIIIGATYVLGLNDVVPMALLVVATYYLGRKRFALAGIILTLAISAKFSMLVALPFFLIYLLHGKSRAVDYWRFLVTISIGLVVLIAPLLLISSSREMIWGNPEVQKIYSISLAASASFQIYLLPVAFVAFLYLCWRVRRPDFVLFQTMLGIGFFVVLLLTPASPGWFVWVVPMLVLYQARTDYFSFMLVFLFSGLFFVGSVIFGPYALVGDDFVSNTDRLYSLTLSVLVAVGIVIVIRTWRTFVVASDHFRITQRPLVVGVAGDSASGKDTFCHSLIDLFGSSSVASLSGDDYHLWDRQRPIWQALTHLNPMANDLAGFSADVMALCDGNAVHPRHYDHATGLRSYLKRLAPANVTLVSGLHALYNPLLRDCYTLSVYLDMDEGLRRFLKIERDTSDRGQREADIIQALDRREVDAVSYIRPQMEEADIVLSLRPVRPSSLGSLRNEQSIRLKVVALSRNGMADLALIRVLIGVCGLHVDHSITGISGESQMSIEGDVDAEDIRLAAESLCPRMIEFLDDFPIWHDGMQGVMQLLALVHINEALNRRLVT